MSFLTRVQLPDQRSENRLKRTRHTVLNQQAHKEAQQLFKQIWTGFGRLIVRLTFSLERMITK